MRFLSKNRDKSSLVRLITAMRGSERARAFRALRACISRAWSIVTAFVAAGLRDLRVADPSDRETVTPLLVHGSVTHSDSCTTASPQVDVEKRKTTLRIRDRLILWLKRIFGEDVNWTGKLAYFLAKHSHGLSEGSYRIWGVQLAEHLGITKKRAYDVLRKLIENQVLQVVAPHFHPGQDERIGEDGQPCKPKRGRARTYQFAPTAAIRLGVTPHQPVDNAVLDAQKRYPAALTWSCARRDNRAAYNLGLSAEQRRTLILERMPEPTAEDAAAVTALVEGLDALIANRGFNCTFGYYVPQPAIDVLDPMARLSIALGTYDEIEQRGTPSRPCQLPRPA